jgi:hypothetical protein
MLISKDTKSLTNEEKDALRVSKDALRVSKDALTKDILQLKESMETQIPTTLTTLKLP